MNNVSPLPYTLPEELSIDTSIARRIIVEFLSRQLEQAGFDRLVLGLSGGLDSALVCYLATEAIGADNVLCLLMPYRTSSPESEADARAVVAALGCPSELVDITPIVDGYFATPLPAGVEVTRGRRGNFAARARMAVLYDRSATWRGLVVGTGNKTETLLGYTTIYGDSAAALLPIADLYKSQVRQLSGDMGVPEQILRKPPTADLWPDQTDEGELGIKYEDLDRLLYWMIDRRRTDEQLEAMAFPQDRVAHVKGMVARAEYKRQMPPVAKLTTRTPGVDYLYPRRRPGSRAGG
ncbi:MAG TPA: NAD+ synthase [Candidatus Limnocylindrales bacterium]|nr:NAD+ synthase [Candidatus Limnocylindrales bacterium]